MKRFLSLALVAIMLLSTLMLASCDLLDQAKDFVHGVFGIEDGEQSRVRTTITREEWVALSNATNYTCRIYSSAMEIAVWAGDDAIRIYYSYDYGEYPVTSVSIYEYATGITLIETATGWVGYEKMETVEPGDYPLNLVIPFTEKMYDELVYDESDKSYSWNLSGETIKFYFKDGELVDTKVISSDSSDLGIEIKNIGTTVVEVPEYTIVNDGKIDPSKADPSVRTTITDEDLINFFTNPNFTLSTIMGEVDEIGGITAQISIKIAGTDLELTASQFGESESQYITLVDGVLYSVERYGDGYLATSMGDVDSILAQLGPIEDVSIVDYLVYDEEGRYYTLDIDGTKFYLFFEDGQLVKAVYVIENAYSADYVEYMEVIILVSDVGTTVVAIPKYTINAE